MRRGFTTTSVDRPRGDQSSKVEVIEHSTKHRFNKIGENVKVISKRYTREKQRQRALKNVEEDRCARWQRRSWKSMSKSRGWDTTLSTTTKSTKQVAEDLSIIAFSATCTNLNSMCVDGVGRLEPSSASRRTRSSALVSTRTRK